jgi:hypothetical protein
MDREKTRERESYFGCRAGPLRCNTHTQSGWERAFGASAQGSASVASQSRKASSSSSSSLSSDARDRGTRAVVGRQLSGRDDGAETTFVGEPS